MLEMSEERKGELLSASERIRGEMELAIQELGTEAALQVAAATLVLAAKSIHRITPGAAAGIIADLLAHVGDE